MPTWPWTRAEQPRSGAVVVLLGSRLELRAYRHIPGFVVAAMRVHRQVRTSPGALGVSLLAQPARKTFWTLSAWCAEASDLPNPNSNAKELWAEAKNRLAAPTEGVS